MGVDVVSTYSAPANKCNKKQRAANSECTKHMFGVVACIILVCRGPSFQFVSIGFVCGGCKLRVLLLWSDVDVQLFFFTIAFDWQPCWPKALLHQTTLWQSNLQPSTFRFNWNRLILIDHRVVNVMNGQTSIWFSIRFSHLVYMCDNHKGRWRHNGFICFFVPRIVHRTTQTSRNL